MDRFKASLAGLGLASSALVGVVVTTAAPAQAMPQDCSKYTNVGYWGQTYCAYGSGSHRAAVRCRYSNGTYYTKYGPWVGTGSVSRAYCNARYTNLQVQGD